MIQRAPIPLRRKLLYLGFVTLVMLGLAEAGLRARAWFKYGGTASVRDPMLTFDRAAGIYVPTPGYELKGRNIHIKINSLGFRGEEISREKPPGTFRIVCLGASTTFSSEVSSNQKTWTHQLQEKLRAAFPGRPIEVVNAAVGGYVAADNLKRLKHHVLPLDPDLVIYYEANNEIVKDTQALAIERGLLAPGGGRQPSWVTSLSKVSLMFDLAYKNLAIIARSRDDSTAKIDKIPKNLPERFIGTLDEMRAMLAERKVPLVLSTFVVKYRRDQDRATQIANADVAFYYMPWMSIDGMLDAMDRYNQAIMDYGKRVGLATIDDRQAIPADSEHFTDCMHLADKGNEAMAERFYRGLRTLKVLDSTPPSPQA
ncbi:MAG TPA: GDSL-type esterase/lipase family protein [Terriglobia bacterium]|nr:GDSL-type esterase/lipase family protein [Terriglobia bacterium]